MGIRGDNRKVLELHMAQSRNVTALQGVIEENSRAIRELSYYIQWAGKTLVGKEAPPFVETPVRSSGQSR